MFACAVACWCWVCWLYFDTFSVLSFFALARRTGEIATAAWFKRNGKFGASVAQVNAGEQWWMLECFSYLAGNLLRQNYLVSGSFRFCFFVFFLPPISLFRFASAVFVHSLHMLSTRTMRLGTNNKRSGEDILGSSLPCWFTANCKRGAVMLGILLELGSFSCLVGGVLEGCFKVFSIGHKSFLARIAQLPIAKTCTIKNALFLLQQATNKKC